MSCERSSEYLGLSRDRSRVFSFRAHETTLENRALCLTKFEQVISNPKASTSASEESSACESRFWD